MAVPMNDRASDSDGEAVPHQSFASGGDEKVILGQSGHSLPSPPIAADEPSYRGIGQRLPDGRRRLDTMSGRRWLIVLRATIGCVPIGCWLIYRWHRTSVVALNRQCQEH